MSPARSWQLASPPSGRRVWRDDELDDALRAAQLRRFMRSFNLNAHHAHSFSQDFIALADYLAEHARELDPILSRLRTCEARGQTRIRQATTRRRREVPDAVRADVLLEFTHRLVDAGAIKRGSIQAAYQGKRLVHVDYEIVRGEALNFVLGDWLTVAIERALHDMARMRNVSVATIKNLAVSTHHRVHGRSQSRRVRRLLRQIEFDVVARIDLPPSKVSLLRIEAKSGSARRIDEKQCKRALSILHRVRMPGSFDLPEMWLVAIPCLIRERRRWGGMVRRLRDAGVMAVELSSLRAHIDTWLQAQAQPTNVS